MEQIVQAICTGEAMALRDGGNSAIAKHPVSGTLHIGALGIDGDEQADHKVHGGLQMAVHQYPLDHHEFWRGEIGNTPLLDDFGAFGSNLAVLGIREHQVRIGDRFRLGSALLEISQPRQPCWKIEQRFQQEFMVEAILKSGRCGWYYRVLEEGDAQAGDALTLEYRAKTNWTIARVFVALWGAPASANQQQLSELAALPALAPKLQARAHERLV